MRSLCISAVVAGAAAFAPQPTGLARPGQALAPRRHCLTMLAAEPPVLPPAEVLRGTELGGAAEVRGRSATPGRALSEHAQGTTTRETCISDVQRNAVVAHAVPSALGAESSI